MDISVCLAAYNGAPWIAAQIRSVLNQLDAGDRLIVSDNGSTDATLEIIRSLSDARVELVHCRERSVARIFEHALAQARGEAILLCDQDNLWLPGRVAAARQALRDCEVLRMDAAVVDEDGAVIGGSLYQGIGLRHGLLANLWRNAYVGCCMGFHRRLLDVALPIPPRLPMHDWWLGLVAEARFSTGFDPVPRMHFRRHGRACSTTGAASERGVSAQLAKRAYLSGQLARRLASGRQRSSASMR